MNSAQLIAIAPQLILSFGIVLSLLLIAWQRSKWLIQGFTFFIFVLALIATLDLYPIDNIQVTVLLLVDSYSLVALVLILISALTITVFSGFYLAKYTEVHDEFYLLLQLVILGAAILVISDHFASVFLGFELLSMALVGMVGYFRESDHGLESAFKYLILSATASSFMLLGIAFIYGTTGSLSFAMASNANHLIDHLYLAGIILFLLGLCFKLSLVPFHYWTPDVYQGAPTPVTMLLATVSKVAIFTVLIKYWFSQVNYGDESLTEIISLIAILSMLVGNVMALRQNNIKRLLGYSSIAHMGYLLIILLITSTQNITFAWQAALFYLAAYLLASLLIFMVLIVSHRKNNSDQIEIVHWRGMFWHQPWLAMAVIISLLSFAGIPLTMGFIGKFYLLVQATQQQLWLLIATLITGSGIALYYYLRIIFVLFAQHQEQSIAPQHGDIDNIFQPVIARVTIAIFSGAIIVIGIFPDVYAYFLSA
ncbi:MAG: NADH-quinone oxidoreductase subunit N [Gammaproteobacteria bacterium]|nr:MAG: NADH-quinone oxidoreductase subunit N [Gammaproteobacteria bacterium]